MATYKRQMISAARSKEHKGQHIISKSGMTVKLVSHTAGLEKAAKQSIAGMPGVTVGLASHTAGFGKAAKQSITAMPGVRMGLVSHTASFKRAVDRSIAAAKKNGNPIAKYDLQRRQAYLEYPDGKRAYVK